MFPVHLIVVVSHFIGTAIGQSDDYYGADSWAVQDSYNYDGIPCMIHPTGGTLRDGERVLNEGEFVAVGVEVNLDCGDLRIEGGTNTSTCSDAGFFIPPLGKCESFGSENSVDNDIPANSQPQCAVPSDELFGAFYAKEAFLPPGTFLDPGTILDLECVPGYEVGDGQNRSICLSSGEWYQLGTCKPSDTTNIPVQNQTCPEPDDVQLGFVEEGENVAGSLRSIVCILGYEIEGASIIACLETGEWTQAGNCIPEVKEEPTVKSVLADSVEPIRCAGLPPVKNGKIGKGNYSAGSAREITCNDGYEIVRGANYVECLETGFWTEPGVCDVLFATTNMPAWTTPEVFQCPPPSGLLHGKFSEGDSFVGTQRLLICDEGYTAYGSQFILCLEDGQWTSSGGCREDYQAFTTTENFGCEDTPQIIHGFVEDGSSVLSSRRNVSCDKGYVMYGKDFIECRLDGTWTFPGFCDLPPTTTEALPTEAPTTQGLTEGPTERLTEKLTKPLTTERRKTTSTAATTTTTSYATVFHQWVAKLDDQLDATTRPIIKINVNGLDAGHELIKEHHEVAQRWFIAIMVMVLITLIVSVILAAWTCALCSMGILPCF